MALGDDASLFPNDRTLLPDSDAISYHKLLMLAE
jgi:hypothetical protein